MVHTGRRQDRIARLDIHDLVIHPEDPCASQDVVDLLQRTVTLVRVSCPR